MARFNRNNLSNYVNHFGRGALLIVGALAIIGLVLATFFYGNETQQAVEDQNQTQQEQTAQQDHQSEAATQNNGQTDSESQTDGQAAGTDAQGGDETATSPNAGGQQVAGETDQSPQEIANTGTTENYLFISVVLFVLMGLYRRSTLALEQAQIQ